MSVGGLQAETRKHNHTLSKSGWYRIFKFRDTGYGLFFIGKIWSVGSPASPLVAFNNNLASVVLKTTRGNSFFLKARVVQKSDHEYYIDIWYSNEYVNSCWIEEIITSDCTFVDFESVPDEIVGVLSEISLC